ncbi:hypothetical protein COCC4DRAFT_32482, partial [Bipolaris maydis ATCC 48331]
MLMPIVTLREEEKSPWPPIDGIVNRHQSETKKLHDEEQECRAICNQAFKDMDSL